MKHAQFLRRARAPTVDAMSSDRPEAESSVLSRRTFIATTVAVGGVVAADDLVPGPFAFGADPAAAETVPSTRVSLAVNGKRVTVTVDNRTSLLDLLRENSG